MGGTHHKRPADPRGLAPANGGARGTPAARARDGPRSRAKTKAHSRPRQHALGIAVRPCLLTSAPSLPCPPVPCLLFFFNAWGESTSQLRARPDGRALSARRWTPSLAPMDALAKGPSRAQGWMGA
eukprot:scaffold3311_cov411-Prasinococcus_capsulatus_cf.AAC.21